LGESEPANKPDERDQDVSKDIGGEIELFVNQIDALAEILPLAKLAIQGVRTEAHQQLGKFFKEECKLITSEGNTSTYEVDVGLASKHQRAEAKRV
jgi:hypothetical protein